MDSKRTPRPFPLVTATLISYAIANAVAMSGVPVGPATAQAPGAYADQHARAAGDAQDDAPNF